MVQLFIDGFVIALPMCLQSRISMEKKRKDSDVLRRDNDLSIKVSLLYWSPYFWEIQVKPLQMLILVALLLNPSMNDLNVPIVGFKGTLWIVVTSFMGTHLGISPSQRVNWARSKLTCF